MDSTRIAELLRPFLCGTELAPSVLEQLRLYLDLLLRWNARMNLTAVRDPEQIVTRHFGESLFAALVLGRDLAVSRPDFTLADVGSGAGFPGVPIKLLLPHSKLTLIESQSKKATFLRETVRTLRLEDAQVFCGRAEEWGTTADAVTLRAVERFAYVLPVAAGLARKDGGLCLLVGADQLPEARQLLGADWHWSEPLPVPKSASRIVAIARHQPATRHWN